MASVLPAPPPLPDTFVSEKTSLSRQLLPDPTEFPLPPVKKGRKYSLSITIHTDGEDLPEVSSETVDFDLQSLPPIPKEDALNLALNSTDEQVQAALKALMTLLTSDPSIRGKLARQSTSQSTRSSVSTAITGDDASIVHKPAPTLHPLRSRHEGYGKYVVGMHSTIPDTPSTSTTAPSTPMSSSFRVTEFVEVQKEHRTVVEHVLPAEYNEDVHNPHLNYPEEHPVRELIAPVRPLAIYAPKTTREVHTPEPPSPPAAVTAVLLEDSPKSPGFLTDEETKPRRWWQFSGTKSAVKPAIATIAADNSTVILPTPPTDSEKEIYAQTRRLPLYMFGTLSFLSVSVGMWFFAVSSKMFYWFGVFGGLIQIYLIISYIVGYAGRDFNMEEHHKLVEEHSYPTYQAPLVDVYLPCCHEPLEVLENTYKYVQKLQYPNFKVYVLDDGGLDTVKALAESYSFTYFCRDNRPHLKKAGNLRWAFARTKGDFFAIFDADFCPRADFLDTMLPYMNRYPDIAIVQSPQFFRPCKEQTWVEQGASATQELFYRIVQVNRDRWGAAICVGSNALYRRAALEEVGGTAEIGHSEDVHTGFYAMTRGHRLKYIPLALACGVSPDTPRAFFSQQMRWCSGSTTLLTNPDFWKSDLNVIQKICFMSGMMYYTAAAMSPFLATMPGLLMLWLNPGLVNWYNFAYAFPSLIYSIFVFRLWSRQRYNINVNFVFVIQQYAYLMAVKDRIFGTTASWVPSGDNKSHVKDKKKKSGNNKYRNMRILCGTWMITTVTAMAVGVSLRIVEGYNWYNFLPLILLDLYNLFIAHKFIFCAA